MARRHWGKNHADIEEDDEYEEYFEEDEDEEDEDDPGPCYVWCGNPDYPRCMDSCKLWDD